jgi:deoxyribonuclease V
VDVQYGGDADPARAACVRFEAWTSRAPASEHVVRVAHVEPYVPGEFYRRELPPILAVLGALPAPPSLVVVDGYVWLDKAGKPGLGARLHAALGGGVPVVGVAKTAFHGETGAVAVTRGQSARPLFVDAIGMTSEEAAKAVQSMHGPHRIPTLLQRVDHLARGRADVTSSRTKP